MRSYGAFLNKAMISFAVTGLLAAGGIDSVFTQRTTDLTIIGTSPVTVLSTTLNFQQTRTVLVVADGRYLPWLVDGTAVVRIRIDGSDQYSNESII